jgi:Abnormal spindle-like microcephaly-assoc'd, ASPM-SPD-2-Hydin/Protein of unknown function (DUF1573)
MKTRTLTQHNVSSVRRNGGAFAIFSVLLIIAASAVLSSCAGYTTASQSSGNSGGNGQGSTPGAGILTPNSTSVTFGNVSVGSTASQTVTVNNTGTATVNIASATISGAGFTVISGSGAVSVPVGQSGSVQVQFAPTSDVASTGTLTVTSDASNSPLSVSLSGTGTEAIMQMSPATLNFSNVQMGQSSTQSVTVTNGGNSNLVVNSAVISGTGFTMSGLTLPATIAAGKNTTFSVKFSPTSTTGSTGTVVFQDNAETSPQTMTLTGSALASGSTLSANPGSVNFGSVVVAGNDPTPVTLTNSGNATITINTVGVTGAGFSISGLTAGQQIAAGATAQFSAAFDPTVPGAATGTISITSSATNGTLSIPVSGTGTQGTLTANPASIPFGNLAVNGSATVPVTLTNTGTAALSITASSVSGTGFSMSSLAAQSLNPGQTASINVTFSPTTATTVNGSVSVSTNLPNSPLTIALSGTGTQAQISANPSSVTFGNVAVGSNGSTQVTLKNGGNSTLTISQINVTGAGMSQTGLSTSTTIAAGDSVNFNAIFTPTSGTAISGSISITTNAAPSPLVINLTGTGTQPQISANPSSVTFGTVTVGNSNSQTVTLKNNGNATLQFTSINVSGAGFSQTGLSTSTTIAAGGSTTFDAIFTPTSGSPSTGSISLNTNGAPAAMTINLSGTGSSPALSLSASPSSLAFGNVNDGSNSSLTTILTNNGNSNITISGVTTTGTGFTASGVANNTTLTPGQTATLTVTFAPTTPGTVTGANVSIASNATNSPAVVTLSGTGTHSVQLSWGASSTGGVTYNVYRGTASGAEGTTPINPNSISGTSFTDGNVASGTIYFYVVKAVNSGGTSTASNEVQAPIPNP